MSTVLMSSLIVSQVTLAGHVAALAFPIGIVLAAALIATVLILLWMVDRKQKTSADLSGQRGIEAYRRFLATRDGEPDLLRHTLSARERLWTRLAAEPVRSGFQPDRIQYERNMGRKRLDDDVDPRMLWLLATAKSNQAERFAVGLAELYGRMDLGDDERVLLHIHLQETYHTRLLADVVAIFGLPVRPRPPALLLRVMIHMLVFTPPQWMLPFTGASEMVGCVLFRAMRDMGCRLFRDEPQVAERIRVLYDQILADEIGHVGYIAARLGPMRRRVMRRLYTLIGPHMVAQMPELRRLCTRGEWRRRFAAFDLEAMAEECHGLAFAAAIP